MGKRPRGLYRTPGWAYVTDGIMTFDITESDYRRSAYKPDYDGLPSKHDYDAAVEAEGPERKTAMARGPKGEKRLADVIGAVYGEPCR